MTYKTVSGQPHREGIQIIDKGIAPEERNILATVPAHNAIDQKSDEPSPELYRQALKVILGTPEIESRLNYITATMIVTIFGGWLTAKTLETRAVKAMTHVLVLFLIATLIGILVGILVGQGVLPITALSVLVLATAFAMLFALGVLVRDMSRQPNWDNQKLSSASTTRRIALPAKTSRPISHRRRVN